MSAPRLSEYAALLPTPFAVLGVRQTGYALAGLDFLPPDTPLRAATAPIVQRLARELDAYFADARHAWDLPLSIAGTPFRQRVWRAIAAIEPGTTRSYGDIARDLDSGARAVGQAVGDNPLPIVIPCHRVLAADGGLGGFMHGRTGFSLDIKRWLLRHEGLGV
jgi:methylated-DNA-[protein]-cysteine S-methyltransferase